MSREIWLLHEKKRNGELILYQKKMKNCQFLLFSQLFLKKKPLWYCQFVMRQPYKDRIE